MQDQRSPRRMQMSGTMSYIGATVLVVIGLGALPVPVQAQTLPAACTNFTDDPIQPGITTVRAQHLDELRACVNALRAQVLLPAATWTDASPQPQQTWVRAVHVLELRSALADVYGARGKISPAYTDATLSAQVTFIRAVHITEIRNGILVVAGVCPPEGCNEVIEYYHVDAVGSVRAVTDEAGAVILRRDYYPFGEGMGPDGSTSLGFTGQEGDAETGLNYVGARYYRAWTGRFTSVDPVIPDTSDPQRWNRYAYALNNPLAYVDPTGALAQGIPGFCSAENSMGGCGGQDAFWSDFGGFGFGDGYAQAVKNGYVPGMPADVWEGLQAFNVRSEMAFDVALEQAQERTLEQHVQPVASVSASIELKQIPGHEGENVTGLAVTDASPLVAVAGDISRRSAAMTQPTTYAEWVFGSAAGGLAIQGARVASVYVAARTRIDGPLATRIVGIRWGGEPVFRLDYGPIQAGGEPVLHVHVIFGTNGMRTHYPIDLSGPPR
jgi:RHS repeat-associated protein